MARERIFSETRHGPPVVSDNPVCRLVGPHRAGSSARSLTRRSVKVNGPNETLFISLLFLVLFLGLSIFVAYGVWLLDLPVQNIESSLKRTKGEAP
jgi:hypothetical protein